MLAAGVGAEMTEAAGELFVIEESVPASALGAAGNKCQAAAEPQTPTPLNMRTPVPEPHSTCPFTSAHTPIQF